mmetsp:Transcript_46211/g.144966  ORF Transcript_46211/g.144966 Transcript_46211/m.144966 type:complete len:230 (-) Transcript_46211:348-1037(-)
MRTQGIPRRGRAWMSTSGCEASRATDASPGAAPTATERGPASGSAVAKRRRRTSFCGRPPRQANHPGVHAGAPGGQAGTLSAVPWRRSIWATLWTSMVGALTSSSRTTRTRLRRVRPPMGSPMRRPGCTARPSGAQGTRRCPSRWATLSPSGTCSTSTTGRSCAFTSSPRSTASHSSMVRRVWRRLLSGSCVSTLRCAASSHQGQMGRHPPAPRLGGASTAPCPTTSTQ